MENLFAHIDKLYDRKLNIRNKPPGAMLWDPIISNKIIMRNFQKKNRNLDSVFIYLSNFCEKNCKDCTSTHSSQKQFLTLTNIKRIALDFEKLKTKYVVIAGGDPFTNKESINILEFLLSLKINISVNTSSPIKANILRWLRKRIVKLQFLVETHEDLLNIKKNLEECKKYDIPTGLIVSLTNNCDIPYIRTIIEFSVKENVKQITFTKLPACCFHNSRQLKIINWKEYMRISKYLLQIRTKVKEKYNLHITSNDALWKGCGAALVSCAIMPNGDVYPCEYLPIKGGNINNKSLLQIWNSKIFNNLSNLSLKGSCGNCKYNIFCRGCRAVSLYLYNRIDMEDPTCWVSKIKKQKN